MVEALDSSVEQSEEINWNLLKIDTTSPRRRATLTNGYAVPERNLMSLAPLRQSFCAHLPRERATLSLIEPVPQPGLWLTALPERRSEDGQRSCFHRLGGEAMIATLRLLRCKVLTRDLLVLDHWNAPLWIPPGAAFL